MAMLDRVAADHGAALRLHVGGIQLGWFSPTEAGAVGAVGAALFALITVAIALGYDMVWFGVLVVTVAEIGLITLPVRMNLIVVQATVPVLRQETVVCGILPFIIADLVRLALLVAVPALTIWHLA